MLTLKIIVVGLISGVVCELGHFFSLLTVISNLVINVIYAECLTNPPARDAGRHCLWEPLFNQEGNINPQKPGDWKCVCCRERKKPLQSRAAERYKSSRCVFEKHITNTSLHHGCCIHPFRPDSN